MSKKNITFFINTLGAPGGTQRVLTSLANLLIEKYNIQVVVIDSKTPFFDLDSKVEIKKIFITNKSKFSSFISFNYAIYKELKSRKSEYYISLDSNSVLLQSLILPRNTKLIVWEHFSLSKNFNKPLFRLSRYYASKRASQFVLLSKQEVLDWEKTYNISSNKISLIYNPITIKEEENSIEIDLYENKRVLAIGNNIEVKGFDYLVEAWSLLKKNGWTLEIVGLPNHESIKIKEIISNYKIENEIIISGRTSNIKQKYVESSIYCLCSRMEATPLVIIESQYVGLPAVMFDNCEGPLELLDNSGLVVEFDDVKEYANALKKLIDSKSLYRELATNAKQNSQRFSNDTFYQKWCEVLN